MSRGVLVCCSQNAGNKHAGAVANDKVSVTLSFVQGDGNRIGKRVRIKQDFHATSSDML